MNPACIEEIAQAIGRKPTRAEIEALGAGLNQQMRELARRDPEGWRSMTREQHLRAAADAAAKAAVEAAEKSAQRKAKALVIQAREVQRQAARADQFAQMGVENGYHKALFERMVNVDQYAAGLRNQYLSEAIDAIHAVDGKFMNLLNDPAKVKAFAKAVIDGDTSDPNMTRAAKAWTDTMEAIRVRSNEAGTDIGKLDYGYMPQPWDVGTLARAKPDEFVADLIGALDRNRYYAADGRPMGDAELADLIKSGHTTLATEGRSKMEPGAARGGSRASRFDDAHRVFHFKDAESYLRVMNKYGRGSMLEAMAGHIGGMTKNIALMEELGPNPNMTYRLLKDNAELRDNKVGVRDFFTTLDQRWATLTGLTAQPVSPTFAQINQSIRSVIVATKLQGTLLSSITDVPNMLVFAKSSGIPMGKAMKAVFSGMGKDAARRANAMAIGIDEITGGMSRWHEGNMGFGAADWMATATMRLGFVDAWTNVLRRGYGLAFSDLMEQMRHTPWEGLTEGSLRRLQQAGVTEADWRVWQLAEAEEFKGARMLTGNGIAAVDAAANGLTQADIDRAVARYLGYMDAESKTAVMSPGLRTRAALQQGTRPGDLGGEALRHLTMFKSFPLAVIDKHLQRIATIPSTKGKLAYSASLLTTLTLLGAVAMQLKDIFAGKDPRDMTTAKFWAAAFMQGGGTGIFGDMFYTSMGGNSRAGQPNWVNFAGPSFSTAFDVADLTLGNAGLAVQGKDTQFGADAARFVKGNTPFINLWYARTALERLVLNDLQEAASPGYLKRMKDRARKDWGQRYWWEPGEALPDRAPDLEAATGD